MWKCLLNNALNQNINDKQMISLINKEMKQRFN